MAARKGYTQKTLAEKMGITIHSMHHYYQSDSLSYTVLEKIAKALECEVWQLVTTEYEVLSTGEGDVLTPSNERIPIRKLKYCFDSKL